MDEFVKKDTGKVLASEVEPSFILGTAQVLTFGAQKYARGNWKKMTEEDRERIKDSLMRHIYALESHIYHASCNLMFLANLDKNKLKEIPDGTNRKIINE
jgi:hypothetical protein